MQAIVTRYAGPTNTRGSRVTAKASAGSVTVYWDHALNSDQNHTAAALALVRKLGWLPSEGKGYAGVWIGGGMPGGDGNVYVFAGNADGWHADSAFKAAALESAQ